MATKKAGKPVKKGKKLGNVKPLSLRQSPTMRGIQVLSNKNPLTF